MPSIAPVVAGADVLDERSDGRPDPRRSDGRPDRRPDPDRWRRRARSAGPAALAFLGARLFDVLVVAFVSRRPSTTYARGDVAAALASWDGGWYRRITETGYPASLSFAPGGGVRHTALAFFPVYPGIVAGLRAVTGLGFLPVALTVALVSGTVAAAGVPLLLAPHLGPSAAARAGVLWACSPVSAVLVMTYSEGLFTAEAVLFLLLLQRRRYRWLVGLVPVMALTRGVLLPFAAVLAVHLWHRRHDLVSASRRALAALAVAGVVGMSLLWPAVVAVRTGRWDAYLLVQESWQHRLVPVLPWGAAVLGLGSGPRSQVRDVVVLAAVVCGALALACLTVGLPAELTTFAIAYLLYVFVLLPPTSSFLRFTVPLITLAAPPAVWLQTRSAMVVALSGCLLGQVWWLQSHLPNTVLAHMTP